jgi:alkylhydroperoxidase family enzyme
VLGARPPGFDTRLGDNNIFSTLARHRDLFRAWLPFGGALLGGGVLPARERELLILRTGWNCASP